MSLACFDVDLLIIEQVRELFDLYDTDGDNALRLNEVVKLMENISKKITSLPAVGILFPCRVASAYIS